MATVTSTPDPVQRALNSRPYLHRRYYPLAAFLIEHRYSDEMRNRIIDWVADGGFLESLEVDGTLEFGHFPEAKLALDAGRAWEQIYRSRAKFAALGMDFPPIRGGSPVAAEAPVLSPPEPDPDTDAAWNDPTADENGDPVYWEDGQPAACPVQPEPAPLPEPSADWDITTLEVEPFHPGFDSDPIRKMRQWHDRNDFRAWLESQGGERI
jgi:hypothetical protein